MSTDYPSPDYPSPNCDRAIPMEDARKNYLGGISRQKLYDLINNGTLRTFKYGRRRFTRPY